MTSQPTDVLPPEQDPEPSPPRAPWLVGVVGLVLAVAAAVLQVLGIVQASNFNWERGTFLAWLAIGASVAAFIVGLVALIGNRGRRWGMAAMVAAVIANPWVLTRLLEALG
jgi:hypothetical protein